MRIVPVIATLLASGLLAASATAQDSPIYDVPDRTQKVPLEGEALRIMFEDKLHRGYYDFLRAPGGDYSFTEMMNADGTTLHIRDGIESEGRWRVMSNLVCFDYDDMPSGCFTFYKQGNCNYAFSLNSNDFVAVTVVGSDEPDCEPAVA